MALSMPKGANGTVPNENSRQYDSRFCERNICHKRLRRLRDSK